MQKPLFIPIGCSRPNLMRATAIFFVATLLVWIPGCPDPAKSNYVTGKVTLDGKQVSGDVTFHGADNKEAKGPIGPDGMYTIMNPPMGTVKITVKPGLMPTLVGGADSPKKDLKDTSMKDAPKTDTKVGQSVPPPKKYESTATSDLTYEVKPGKQEHNLTLVGP